MPTITLQDIQDAADRKYGPFIIEGIPGGPVTLLNALRLTKVKRDKLQDLQAKANDKATSFDESLDLMKDILRLASKTAADATRLLKAIGDDQTVLVTTIQEYGQASQVGEASPSQS